VTAIIKEVMMGYTYSIGETRNADNCGWKTSWKVSSWMIRTDEKPILMHIKCLFR